MDSSRSSKLKSIRDSKSWASGSGNYFVISSLYRAKFYKEICEISMLRFKAKVFSSLLIGAALTLSGCKQVALITASDSTRELASAADNGDAKAAYSVGMRYTQGLGETQNYALGLDYFETAAKLGLIEAQYMLGMGYYLGRGTAVDYAEARRWLSAAADQGHTPAMQTLGEIYYNGYGVTRAPIRGIYWSLQAAEADDAQAQYLVGISYLTGLGSNKARPVGEEWLMRSAQGGDQRARTLLDTLNLQLRGATRFIKHDVTYHQTRYIQLRLQGLGHNPGTIDGLWGSATANALKAHFGRTLDPTDAFEALLKIPE